MRTLMMSVIALAFAFAFATNAHAQLGGILDKIDRHKDKVKKGADAMTAMTRDFTEDEEADIGRVVAARVLQTYPLSKNEKLQQYVSLVGHTVAQYSARPTLEWHFAVIETPVVNAFSCPGGFIFVTTGAIEAMKSEAELAALLGHEIAHATQKHILKEIKRANAISAGMDLAKTASSGSFLDDALGEKISNLAYEKLFTKGLSRRDEQEADRIGIEIAQAAGYRASEFVHFLETLQKLEGSSQLKVLISTHPSAKERIPVVKKAAGPAGEVLADRWKEWTGR